MIDDSPEALAEVIAFGNWWHGSYRPGEGFFSRSGVAQAILNASSVANTQRNVVGRDAHLVDFDRTVVETPAEESAIGMERWNKAILYGKDKYYSILGSFNLGAGGWPYRAPDGFVWHLQARYFAPSTVIVFGNVLRSDITVPSVQLAEIEVPADDTTSTWSWQTKTDGVSPLTLNFNPKGGAQAAAHRYGPQKVPMWIVEFSVSGGSATTPPVVSAAVTFNRSSASTVDIGCPIVYVDDTLINPVTGQTYTWPNQYVYPQVPINQVPDGYNTSSQVLAVVWDANGNRCVLRLVLVERMLYTYGEFVRTGPEEFQQLRTKRTEWRLQFRSNDTVMASIDSDELYERMYITTPTTRYVGDMTRTESGNLYSSQVPPIYDLRFPGVYGQQRRWFTTMPASNTFLIGITAYGTDQYGNSQPDATRIIGYASAEGAVTFGWPSPWDGESESILITINPLTGEYSADTTMYF